jgi:glycosyltransferase involved in cell wall biosynthesis
LLLPLSLRLKRWNIRHILYRARLPFRRRRWSSRAISATRAYEKDQSLQKSEGRAIVIGDFSGNNGLSRGASYDLQFLKNRHPHIEILDIGKLSRGGEVFIAREDAYEICYLFLQPDNYDRVFRLFDPKQLKKAYRVARCVWETPVFPDAWRFAVDLVHEIWTPSEFSATGLRASGLPVHVVPHYVDGTPVERTTDARARFGLAATAFVGVSIMDIQSCPERKNPWAHVIAWRKAFGDSENAILVLKVRLGKRTRCVLEELEFLAAGAKNIRIFLQDMQEEDITALQSAADVFLSLHRSEGYGLTIHEGLLTGRPVVATDWSANSEFGPDFPNYHPVRYRMVPYRDWMNHYPGTPFEWADADTDHAAEILRRLSALKRS